MVMATQGVNSLFGAISMAIKTKGNQGSGNP